jgi:Haem-containing dehydratase
LSYHPTYLAIFGTFMQEMAPLGDAMQLRLWHEVMVLPATAQHAVPAVTPLQGQNGCSKLVARQFLIRLAYRFPWI